jgi:hypothetical protein
MGLFASFAYSAGRWTEKPAVDWYLSITVNDSDFATVEYRPAPGSSGRFYVGWQPRDYFENPGASAEVDVDAEAAGLAAWSLKVLGRAVSADDIALFVAPEGVREPEDVFVEETLERLLKLLGLQLPGDFGKPDEGDELNGMPETGAVPRPVPERLRPRLEVITPAVLRHGFSKHGKSWMLRGDDLAWIFDLDKKPGTARFSIDMGLDLFVLSGTERPSSANNCKIVIHRLPETESGVTGYEARAALGLDSDLDPEYRAVEIVRIVVAAANFAQARMELENLRRSRAAGDLIGFISWEARAILEAEPGL